MAVGLELAAAELVACRSLHEHPIADDVVEILAYADPSVTLVCDHQSADIPEDSPLVHRTLHFVVA